ncbi:hypothetical protein C6356_29930 [Bacillus wiedmannii]|nr:hypothetical protein C6356_29930 [Bacillus wiedmannii]
MKKRVPIYGALFYLPLIACKQLVAYTNHIQVHTEHIQNVFKRIQDAYFRKKCFPKSEHEKSNRHSLFLHFLYKVGFGFLMLFFIGMGLGMNMGIAVVLSYGYFYGDSNRECDCVNGFWVVERIEKN